MATKIKPTETSLADFTFSSEEEWFGKKVEADPMESLIKEVKDSNAGKAGDKATVLDDFDKDLENNDESISFFDIKDVDTQEPDFNPDGDDSEDDKKTKSSKKNTSKKEETEVENEEEIEKEEEKTDTSKIKKDVKSSNKEKEGSNKEEADNEDEGDIKFYTTLTQEMKERGIFSTVEIKDDEEVDIEKFYELQEGEIEARVDETFQAFAEEMDEDGKDFIRFKKSGGKTEDYLANIKSRFALKEFDQDNDAHIDYVLKHYLSEVEEMDAEEVIDRIKWLNEGGKSKSTASKYFEKLRDADTKRQEALLKVTERAAAEKEKANREFNNSIKETLEETEKVGSFPISKAEAKVLSEYMTKPTVKIGKNKYVPQLQMDISKIFRAETKEDKQKLIMLSKLIKNNFEVTDLVDKVNTKIVNRVQSKLKEAKENPKGKSGAVNRQKSLADYF